MFATANLTTIQTSIKLTASQATGHGPRLVEQEVCLTAQTRRSRHTSSSSKILSCLCCAAGHSAGLHLLAAPRPSLPASLQSNRFTVVTLITTAEHDHARHTQIKLHDMNSSAALLLHAHGCLKEVSQGVCTVCTTPGYRKHSAAPLTVKHKTL